MKYCTSIRNSKETNNKTELHNPNETNNEMKTKGNTFSFVSDVAA